MQGYLKAAFKEDYLLAIVMAVALVLLTVAIGFQNNKVVPTNADPLAHYTQEPHNRLSFMANWDGPIYINLSQHGYATPTTTNFFPLYPILVRAVNFIVSSPLYSALIVAWSGLVGALYFYLKLLKRYFTVRNNAVAIKGLLLFALFPGAVFMVAPYTESLFACFSLAAIYLALKQQYWLAGMLALLASATHINGIFVALLVAYMCYAAHQKILKVLGVAATGALGLVGYMVYLAARFHDPLAFVHAQKAHGWLSHDYLHEILASLNVFTLLSAILVVVAVIYWWPRNKGFAAYAALYLCIPLLGGQFGGFVRYALMAFPLQLMLFQQLHNRQSWYAVALVILAVTWTFFALQYAGGYVGGG